MFGGRTVSVTTHFVTVRFSTRDVDELAAVRERSDRLDSQSGLATV